MAGEAKVSERLQDFSSLGREEQDLVKASLKARENAYCPYSNFSVGAAVRVSEGNIFTGCNVENAASPVGICAEQTAFAKAISEGNTRFIAVAVSGELPESMKTFVFPCGSCRQFMSEFAKEKDIIIYLVKPDLKKVLITSIRELLPHSFNFG